MQGEMLSNVIGAPFSQYIIDQLTLRAANNSSQTRSNDQLVYLANKMSWTRLTSSVRVNPKGQTLQQFYGNLFDGEISLGDYPNNDSLAKNWVLQAGTSQYNNGQYNLRYGLGPNGAYGLGGIEQQGFRPMPGIESVTIESKGTLGSLREATINFKVWNIVQLNIIEALYFRLGYTMLLEWGHVNYFNNKNQFITDTSGIDIFDPKLASRKELILQKIAQKSKETDGNYEAMLGTVTNFYFSFNAEGGFDCNLKLIGLGSIIDTIRINQTFVLPNNLKQKIQQQEALIQQKLDEEAKQRALNEDRAKRLDEGKPAVTVAAAKNVDGVKRIYQSAKSPNSPEGVNVDLSTISFTATQYIAAGSATATDYYYKADGPSQAYNTELNSTRTGLFLSTTARRSGFQLISADVSTNPQPVVLDVNLMSALSSENRQGFSSNASNFGTVLFNVGTVNVTLYPKTQFTIKSLNLEGGLWDTRSTEINTTDNLIGIVDYSLKAYNGDLKPNEVVKNPFEFYIAYVVGDSQKFFYVNVGTVGNYTRQEYIDAITNWFRNTKTATVDQVQVGSVAALQQRDVYIHGNLTGIQIKGNAVPASYSTNDSGIILQVLPRTNTVAPTTPALGNANPQGNTQGGENQTSPQQGIESGKFSSALHAMLVAVKAEILSKGLSKSETIVGVDLGENTDLFYQFGVLKNVLSAYKKRPKAGQTGGVSGYDNLGDSINQFDITQYAIKGFNSNLMVDQSKFRSIKDVNFQELCTGYLIKYQFSESNSAQVNQGELGVYIKLGYLLAFLNNMCLLYESIGKGSDSKTDNTNSVKPYIYIDFHPDYNFCLTAPQHFTVDPTVCLIPFQATDQQYLELFTPEVRKSFNNTAFKPSTDNPISTFINSFKTDNAYQGKTMEILLNVQYLISTANEFIRADKDSAVNLKPFLDKILEDVNKSTGGFNLFRVAYRDDSNTVIIKDDQWTPNLPNEAASVLVKSSYKANRKYMELQIFGSGSLVRDMEFKTNMSTKMSSMIAISAQSANWSANSLDTSPIGTYNINYDDAIMPVKENSVTTGSGAVGDVLSKANKLQQEQREIENVNFEAARKFDEHVAQVYRDGRPAKSQIQPSAAYYLERLRKLKSTDSVTTGAAFIPANLSLTMDGISGIVMGNAFGVPEERLPASLRGYDGTTKVGFTVVGLTHTLEGNQWLTKIRGQMITLRDAARVNTAKVTGQNLAILTVPSAASANLSGKALYNDAAFRAKLKKIADTFQISDEDVLKVMNKESGLNPARGLYRQGTNPPKYSNSPQAGYTLVAAGLIQFTNVTLGTIGVGSLEEVLSSNALTQLDYVEKYFKANRDKIQGADIYRLYAVVFLPGIVPALISGRDGDLLQARGLSANLISSSNPIIATSVGKVPGTALTVGDFKKYVNTII
jgi:hypothetical protein